MKRFWKTAGLVAAEDGWAVHLDGRPVLTPARASLLLPGKRLAEAVGAEWQQSGEIVDPRAMPLTGLANAAIDRVAPDPTDFCGSLARYAQSDLLLYRAAAPQVLVDRQAAAWDPLLHWARRRYDLDFVVASGIIFKPQPSATVARLEHAVATLDPFRLAGLSPLVSIGGSLIAGLAVLEGETSPDEGWSAVAMEDEWQLEKWGRDEEAEAMLAGRHAEWMSAARFLSLLD